MKKRGVRPIGEFYHILPDLPLSGPPDNETTEKKIGSYNIVQVQLHTSEEVPITAPPQDDRD